MESLLDWAQNNPIQVVSYLITVAIALFSLYESYKNKKKFEQLNKESLVSKVAVDFDYKTEKTDNFKIVKGKMTFTNRGSTNIKLVKLNFDVKDRSDELEKAFVPNTPEEKYSTISEGVSSIDLLGFNNSRQLSFKNPSDKYFEIFRTDSAYVVPKGKYISDITMEQNLNTYIEQNIEKVYDYFKDFETNKDKIKELLIGNLLIREIRGFQLFPGESLTQEFVASYKGSGSIILNVEASSLRFLQRSMNKGEEFKALIDKCVDSKVMDETTKLKIIELLKASLHPANTEVMDYRKTFLIYLP
jgi:hypothetical protein